MSILKLKATTADVQAAILRHAEAIDQIIAGDGHPGDVAYHMEQIAALNRLVVLRGYGDNGETRVDELLVQTADILERVQHIRAEQDKAIAENRAPNYQ